jgi:hypothetical protein
MVPRPAAAEHATGTAGSTGVLDVEYDGDWRGRRRSAELARRPLTLKLRYQLFVIRKNLTMSKILRLAGRRVVLVVMVEAQKDNLLWIAVRGILIQMSQLSLTALLDLLLLFGIHVCRRVGRRLRIGERYRGCERQRRQPFKDFHEQVT